MNSFLSVPDLSRIKNAYVLFRDDDFLCSNEVLEDAIEEMKHQVIRFQGNYLLPEYTTWTEPYENGVAVWANVGNSLTSYSSKVGDFHIEKY